MERVITLSLWIGFVLLALFVVAFVPDFLAISELGLSWRDASAAMKDHVVDAAKEFWTFAKPILQLALVLYIFVGIAERLGWIANVSRRIGSPWGGSDASYGRDETHEEQQKAWDDADKTAPPAPRAPPSPDRPPFDFQNVFSVQTYLAVLIVTSFIVTQLANIPGTDALKDLSLVVIGFYFGTRVRQQGDRLVLDDGRPKDKT